MPGILAYNTYVGQEHKAGHTDFTRSETEVLELERRNRRKLSPSPCLMMFHVLCLMLLHGFFHAASGEAAGSWYVVPQAEIPLRGGQGSEYRILAVVRDGTEVELIEDDGTWALVRLASGKEGWMLKRYLSSDPPLAKQVASLKADKTDLERRAEELMARIREFEHEQGQCTKDLGGCTAQLESVRGDYEALKVDAADVMNLKQALEETGRELQKARKRLTESEQENQHLRNNDRIKWFLAGGGVLIIGWVIGMVMGRGRRRRPSLL